MKAILIGHGEIGRGIEKVFAPYHEITICDVKNKPDGEFEIMLVAIPYGNDFCKVIDD